MFNECFLVLVLVLVTSITPMTACIKATLFVEQIDVTYCIDILCSTTGYTSLHWNSVRRSQTECHVFKPAHSLAVDRVH